MKSYKVLKNNSIPAWDNIKGIHCFENYWKYATNPERMELKAFYNNNRLALHFKVYCSHPLIYINSNHKMEVTQSERVEIFFRTNKEMHPYYCLEIDAYGRLLDYKANHYRKFEYDWQWPTKLEIETNIEPDHYSVSIQIPIEDLINLSLLNNKTLETGLFRGFCKSITNGKANMEWISWINPDMPKADFHIPEVFGKLILE